MRAPWMKLLRGCAAQVTRRKRHPLAIRGGRPAGARVYPSTGADLRAQTRRRRTSVRQVRGLLASSFPEGVVVRFEQAETGGVPPLCVEISEHAAQELDVAGL